MARNRRAAAFVAVAVLLAGCGGDGGSANDRQTPSKPAKGTHWAYEDVARDAKGSFHDVVALAADDIWATAVLRTGGGAEGRPYLFHYDGREWQRQDMPAELDGAVHHARFAASGPDNMWLFGEGNGAAQETGPGIARWDGSRWHRVPKPPGPLGTPVVFGADDVWGASGHHARHWDGKRWNTVRLPATAGALDGRATDDLWAVGHRTSGAGVDGEQYSQPAAMHWDGRTWTLTDTPTYRFPDPQPPEASAGLDRVRAVSADEVWADGLLSFNHGEVENEPQNRSFTLRWDGTRWTDVTDAAPGCDDGRDPAPDGHGGLIYLNRWHLTSEGVCRKTTRSTLPATGGITRQARQSLWFDTVVPVPGTRKLIAAGHMQVNQSGNPMSKPLLATLELP